MANVTLVHTQNTRLTQNVQLTLTPQEAHALLFVLGRVVGPTTNTIRKYTDDIYIAIEDETSLIPHIKMPHFYVEGELTAIEVKPSALSALGSTR